MHGRECHCAPALGSRKTQADPSIEDVNDLEVGAQESQNDDSAFHDTLPPLGIQHPQMHQEPTYDTDGRTWSHDSDPDHASLGHAAESSENKETEYVLEEPVLLPTVSTAPTEQVSDLKSSQDSPRFSKRDSPVRRARP